MVTKRQANQTKGTIRVKDVLQGKSSKYKINKFLGEGTYGKVAECIKVRSKNKVAVKIVWEDWIGMKEVRIHEKLKMLDANKNNMARTTEHFMHQGYVCLAFEMLDISFYDFMKKRNFLPLLLSEIRVITQQMLVALNALKSIHLVHGDIKPDNIMMVNHELQPFKLKLIDFGLALPVSRLKPGIIIQACSYRAPEVILGLPLSEAVDMWSLGCVLAFLYLGHHLFPNGSENEVMNAIVKMLGQPDKQLLDSGIRTGEFFSKDQDCPNAPWRLITGSKVSKFSSVDDIVKTRPETKTASECEDTQAFLSLLKHMLHVDPVKRISPSEALGHRFITMIHLRDSIDDQYVASAHSTIENSRLEPSSVEFERFITSSEEKSHNRNTNNGPPAKAGLDHTTTAGTVKKPSSTNRKCASFNQKLDGIIASSDEGATEYVEVKTRKKWIKRIGQFFSRFFKSACCSTSSN